MKYETVYSHFNTFYLHATQKYNTHITISLIYYIYIKTCDILFIYDLYIALNLYRRNAVGFNVQFGRLIN